MPSSCFLSLLTGHVNRLANIGGYFASCLPKSLLESEYTLSPLGHFLPNICLVGQGQSEGESPTTSYQVMGGGSRQRLGASTPSSQTSQVFSGTGTSLGSASGSNNESEPRFISPYDPASPFYFIFF